MSNFYLVMLDQYSPNPQPLCKDFITRRTSTPCDESKPVEMFNTVDEANTTIQSLIAIFGNEYLSRNKIKFQMRRAPTDNGWRAREALRLTDGTYSGGIEWVKEAIYQYFPHMIGREDGMHTVNNFAWKDTTKEHYAHPSLKQLGCVAFTKDAINGAADTQTIITLATYLRRYSNIEQNYQCCAIVDKISMMWEMKYFADKYQLEFARTEEEIATVYTTGPQSCMSYAAANFISTKKVHPSIVYAAGDLAVAYLRENRRIIARTLVWPEKKIYSRLYGEDRRLSLRLDTAGYKQDKVVGDSRHRGDGTLVGARVQKIAIGNNFIMPYIDNYSIKDCGDRFEFAYMQSRTQTVHDAKEQTGLLVLSQKATLPEDVENDEDLVTCSDCDQQTPSDNIVDTYHGNSVCRRCLDRNYSYSVYHDAYMHDENSLSLIHISEPTRPY